MARLYPHNGLTWVRTSADDGPTYIDGHEKDGIMVLAAVSASEIVPSLFLLAAGKTPRIETS
jgi:hypothetical protein